MSETESTAKECPNCGGLYIAYALGERKVDVCPHCQTDNSGG